MKLTLPADAPDVLPLKDSSPRSSEDQEGNISSSRPSLNCGNTGAAFPVALRCAIIQHVDEGTGSSKGTCFQQDGGLGQTLPPNVPSCQERGYGDSEK